MPEPTIKNGEEHFFTITYEGNGDGQRVGNFVPYTDNGTIAKSCIFERDDSPRLNRTPSGSGTSTRIYTLSVWAKPTVSSSASHERFIITAGPYGNSDSLVFKDNRIIQFWINGAAAASLKTDRTFKDSSKFYHILVAVDTTQSTASDRIKMYIDGDQITSFSTENYPSQNYDGHWGTAVSTNVGSSNSPNRYMNGYLAEVNYVDGTAYTPSTFGLTDTSTGRWIPKTLTGISYGTNGFRLEFANSAGQTIGDDTSGNGNDFTVTNLATTDIVTDSPTQNHSGFNPVADETTNSTLTQGNLTTTISGYGTTITNIALPTSGKYYWEFKATYTMDGNTILGVQPQNGIGFASSGQFPGGNQNPNSFGIAPAQGGSSKVQAVKGSTFTDLSLNKITTSGTFLQFCWDGDTGSLWFGYNNSFEGDPGAGTGAVFTGINDTLKILPAVFAQNGSYEVNFGQRGFEYTPPSGFVALQQDNLPETEKGITSMTWVKNRETTNNPMIVDSSRGQSKHLYVDRNDAQLDYDQRGMIKFLKGGYSCGEYNFINGSGNGIVSWNWVANAGTTASNGNGSITSTVQANQTAGFSIVQYTGTGSNATVGHGLSSAPDWILVKNLSTGSLSWTVQHKFLTATSYLHLDLSNTSASATSVWNDTNPTSTVFSVGTANAVNKSSSNMIAYCWHEVDGYSKFGDFVGTGNSNGPFVFTGFKPALVIIKSTSHGNNWIMWDHKRSAINPCDNVLYPDLNQAETTSGNDLDFLSNGFKCRGTNTNYNGSSRTYIYMAFAEHPFIGNGTNPVTAR